MKELIDLLGFSNHKNKILYALSDYRLMSLSDISKQTNISRSISFKHLQELKEMKIIQKNYSKGKSLYMISDKEVLVNYIENNFKISETKLKFAENFYKLFKNKKHTLNTSLVKLIKKPLISEVLDSKVNYDYIFFFIEKNTKDNTFLKLRDIKNSQVACNVKCDIDNFKFINILVKNNFCIFINSSLVLISYDSFEEYICIKSNEIANFFIINFKLLWNMN